MASDVDVHPRAAPVAAGAAMPRRVADAVVDARPGRSTRSQLAARRRRTGWAIVGLGLPVLTVVLEASGPDVALASVLMLYLLVVTLGAAVGGPWPAAVGALGGFGLANWYFTPPVHHWKVSSASDLLALFTFAMVAAVVAGLVVHAARRQVESTSAQDNARILAAMSGASVGDDPLELLLEQLRSAFQLTAARIIGRADGCVEGHAGPRTDRHGDLVLDLGPDHQLVLDGGPLSPDDLRILTVFAEHLTTALRTRRLRHEASSAAALAEANAFRTAILAAVSHDLRTPLSSIKASVTSLRQHDVTWSTAAVDEFLATIDEETDRLNGLIGNLLDLSRLQTNTLRILERDIGLEEITPAAIASLGRDLAARVDSDISESLPRVRVDPGLLERALANIVANAVAWSPPAGRVRVDAVHVPHRVELRVVDRGPGIPAGARAQVFEPFQRLGDRGTNGVGLGLAVARGFVPAMSGDLSVEDTPGGGTTLVLSLPLAP